MIKKDNKMIKLILVSCVLFFSACTSDNYKLLQTKEGIIDSDKKTLYLSAKSIEYLILPQDRLEITLYKDPNQNSMVSQQEIGQKMNNSGILVNTLGYISLPLVGNIKVSGLSQSNASNKITQRYKQYFNTVVVYLEVLNKRVIVLGEVKNPGVVKIDKEKLTLFEALAFAGDLTDEAVRDNIIILSHTQQNKMTMRRVDLTNFNNLNYASLMLRPNDIVYVQPNNWKEFQVASDNFTSIFRTIGAVITPFVTLKFLTQ